MTVGTQALIDLSALTHNLNRVREYIPSSASVMAMVKANAYGHGLLQAVSALSDADCFGVARLEEALMVRNHYPLARIVVMAGFIDVEELQVMAEYAISPVVHNEQQLCLLKTTQLSKPLTIWIKVDSGMHRLGFDFSEFPKLYQRLIDCPQINKPIGVMTHFAKADELNQEMTILQMDRFFQIANTHVLKSLANSAAIIAWPATHQDWVRPGIMLYGISPFTDKTGLVFNLKPVMTLQSRLIAIHDVAKNETIGYGGTWECSEDMRIGVAAVGYGDGYPRQVKNGTPVLVNGVRCALVGRVSMDLMTIDLSHCPSAQIGDPVILWGNGLSIEEIAQNAGTISYELLCKVTSRVEFVFNRPSS